MNYRKSVSDTEAEVYNVVIQTNRTCMLIICVSTPAGTVFCDCLVLHPYGRMDLILILYAYHLCPNSSRNCCLLIFFLIHDCLVLRPYGRMDLILM